MKYLAYLRYVLLGSSALVGLSFFFIGEMAVDLMLRWAYIMLLATIACAIIFPIVNIVSNPKTALRSLVGLGILALIVGISYALSSADPVTFASGELFTDETTLRLSDMGLYTTYVAMAATIGLIVVTEIANIFR